MDRCFQALLMFSTAALSWLLMLAVHELGHVLHGWLSGATLDAVHLPLVGFSRTDFAVNPHPLFVAWGGALWGCVLPLAILVVARCFAAKRHLYLARLVRRLLPDRQRRLSAWRSDSDRRSRRRRRHSSTRRRSLATDRLRRRRRGRRIVSLERLGPYFGLGPSRGRVDRKAAVGVTIALLAVACIEALLANR